MVNKVYKGYELIKEIAEGNIKKGTRIKDTYTKGIAIYDGANFRQSETDGRYWTEMYDDIEFAKRDFELIEDQTIDIDSIEELKEASTETYDIADRILCFENRDKINQLIQAVKHLNKEIQSIKEK